MPPSRAISLLPAEFAGDAERYILGAATANGRSPADTTWNRLPGAVGPGFRPSVGAMLNLLRLPFNRSSGARTGFGRCAAFAWYAHCFLQWGKGARPPLPCKGKIGLPVLPPLARLASCRIDADPHPRILRRPFGRAIPLRFVPLPPSPPLFRTSSGSRSGAPAPRARDRFAGKREREVS